VCPAVGLVEGHNFITAGQGQRLLIAKDAWTRTRQREGLNPDNILLEDFLLLGNNYFWFLDHIDAWSGVLFETPIPGGLVGQTNAAIIGDQFKRLKFGDRFFFTHETETETSVLKREVFQRTLSSVICDNVPNIKPEKLGVIQLPVEAMKQGGTASCPEIQGEGKAASESPTLDFAALALEIVNSLEGKETDGLKPLISSNNTDTVEENECSWDSDCEETQVDNKTLLFCISRRCAYVRGRCVADVDCGEEGYTCHENYCQVDQTTINDQRCSAGCNVEETCGLVGGKPVCNKN